MYTCILLFVHINSYHVQPTQRLYKKKRDNSIKKKKIDGQHNMRVSSNEKNKKKSNILTLIYKLL